MIEIVEVRKVTVEVFDAYERLIPQLTTSSPPPSIEDLQHLVFDSGNTLLIARDHSEVKIVGCAMLHLYRKTTGFVGVIEDVVVDESARGQGVGEKLVAELLARAKNAGAQEVNLTSNPKREAANRLYQRMGFESYDTNHYRYTV